jgi:hypothetical protein
VGESALSFAGDLAKSMADGARATLLIPAHYSGYSTGAPYMAFAAGQSALNRKIRGRRLY